MVELQKFIDKWLGGLIILLLYPLSLFKQKRLINKPKKILLIKLWAIGDSIISLSLLNAIKKKYPTSTIDVLTRERILDVYESYDLIDNIINYDKNWLKIIFSKVKYDLVFDTEPYLNLSAILSFKLGKFRIGFSNQFRSTLYNKTVKFDKKQHMVDNYLDMIRLLGHKYKTNQLEELNNIPDESKEPINDYLKQNKIKKKDLIIGLTPGVAESAKNRMWYEDRFANLADKLIKENKAKILFIDGPSNRDVVSSIISQMKEKSNVFEPKFKLQETFYLISKCSIFISNDTGPMHIAAAQGCKTIGLFGPNTPVLWGPYGKNNISIYKTKLSPCIENDKGIAPNINREEYMGPITVNDVYNAVIKLLKS